jgi:Family of unknown function (DUF6286)
VILLARALVRIVSFLLLLVLAVAGLAAAVFSIGEGASGPSYSSLAKLVRLPQLRDTVGPWLAQLEAPGPTAGIALLCGLGAMLLGLLLLAGLLVPRRERLVALRQDDHGAVNARRRALAQVAEASAERVPGVAAARATVRPRRTSGGRLKVRAVRVRSADARQVRDAVAEQMRSLTEPFKLKARVEARLPRRGARVQ